MKRVGHASSSGPSVAGFLVVDKPVGISSMDAVAAVRRRAGGARSGHAGTLDPLASGVLVIALGRPATRLIERFMATEKRYRTVVDLSANSTTDDLEGELLPVAVAAPPPRPVIDSVLAAHTGSIRQRPPAASAIKVAGRRAYTLARRGEVVEMAPRTVEIRSLRCLRYEWPGLELDVRCSKGTYIRSLARDIGAALGTGGHCASLRRTAVGPFTDAEASAIDALPDAIGQADLMTVEAAMARLASPGSAQ